MNFPDGLVARKRVKGTYTLHINMNQNPLGHHLLDYP